MILDGPTAYITGPDGLPLEQITAGGTVRWFHHDQLGSTTSLTNAAGATVQSYTYDAYGQLTSATPTVENPFRYAGQYTDDQTGLQYLRARYYDPATGQFLSRDPLEDSTLQPYAYADNNPTNTTDPAGLSRGASSPTPRPALSTRSAGGYSTKLAAAIFHFDVDCADFGPGFGTGQMLGRPAGCSPAEPKPHSPQRAQRVLYRRPASGDLQSDWARFRGRRRPWRRAGRPRLDDGGSMPSTVNARSSSSILTGPSTLVSRSLRAPTRRMARRSTTTTATSDT